MNKVWSDNAWEEYVYCYCVYALQEETAPFPGKAGPTRGRRKMCDVSRRTRPWDGRSGHTDG